MAYTFHPRHTLQLTYQQRVIRPLGSELSSFIDNTDITHVIVGNPSLHDEYIHTLELNWQWVLSNFRMTPAIYYRNRQNRIVEIATQLEEETLWQKCNSGTSQTFGADLSLRWQPLRLLDLGLPEISSEMKLMAGQSDMILGNLCGVGMLREMYPYILLLLPNYK